MPLLGRHKSLPIGAKHQQAVGAATTAAVANKQPVCESPLFGTRRQLPINSAATTTNNNGKQANSSYSSTSSRQSSATTITQSTTSHNLDKQSKQQQQQTDNNSYLNQETLSSIPQQITSQQIHYAFSIMDTNSDGLIDLRDLSQMLANLGVPIDEAILSHVMSTVSKRGDHRISEKEFLNWISEFIQICDPKTTTGTATGSRAAATAGRSRSPIVRSSTAGSSLALQQPEVPTTTNLSQRRGSGSGLALMRSLSNSIGGSGSEEEPTATKSTTSSQQQKTTTARRGRKLSSSSSSTSSVASAAAPSRADSTDETKNDLRAAFCVFDLDGDGFITLDEVQAGLKLLGETWTQNELNQLFSLCGKRTTTPTSQKEKSKQRTAGKLQQQQQQQQDLDTKRISIDEFVQLLL